MLVKMLKTNLKPAWFQPRQAIRLSWSCCRSNERQANEKTYVSDGQQRLVEEEQHAQADERAAEQSQPDADLLCVGDLEVHVCVLLWRPVDERRPPFGRVLAGDFAGPARSGKRRPECTEPRIQRRAGVQMSTASGPEA